MRQPGAGEIALGLSRPDHLRFRAQTPECRTVNHPCPVAFEGRAPRPLRRLIHEAGARVIVVPGDSVVHASTLPRPTDVRLSPIDSADDAPRGIWLSLRGEVQR